MAGEPGELSDFGQAAGEEWDGLLARLLGESESPHLLRHPDQRTPDLIPVDWGAFPVRVTRCLGGNVGNALRLLDWRTEQGDLGRAYLHEEYLEWRVVRDELGRPRRVEMTTEFAAYWEVLAAHHPATVIELAKRFSGETVVRPEAVFGGLNPFDPSATPETRRRAFEDAMLPRGGRAPWSAYNNGRRAICFMSQGANTVRALVKLVAAAAFPYLDGESGQAISGPQAIASGTQAAQACRNSDPTVVGATIGLAAAGRLFALDDPIGVYIRGVQAEQLLTPDGTPVPDDWFQRQRGSRPRGGEGLERSQRLVFEVPAGVGFGLGDLIDASSGQRIEFGGQIANLVQLAVYLRVGPEGAVPVDPIRLASPEVVPCERDPRCEPEVLRRFREFEQLSANLLAATPEAPTDRAGGPAA
ncbi:MAG: hypothetical protein ACR2ML_04570 [Solirubrobacteraceae bacterium]